MMEPADIPDAAQHYKYQDHDGHVVAEVIRGGGKAGQVVGVQYARQACQRRGNGKCHQFIFGDIDPHGLCRDPVVPDGHNGAAVSGIYQVCHDKQCDQKEDNADQ